MVDTHIEQEVFVQVIPMSQKSIRCFAHSISDEGFFFLLLNLYDVTDSRLLHQVWLVTIGNSQS